MTRNDGAAQQSPITSTKTYDAPSEFTPENLLREARRQKSLAVAYVPWVCVLDPDGDIVRHLQIEGRARRHQLWPCYHTDLYCFELGEQTLGIVGRAVGAPFAVLVAEELFASGCQLLISITSAGQICTQGSPPYFVLIERALRDESTSYHYPPAAKWSMANAEIVGRAEHAVAKCELGIERGTSWTTDAPFRETAAAITAARERGAAVVEMEAAALYAFASARCKPVLCVAHVTNRMGQIEGDFGKRRSSRGHRCPHVDQTRCSRAVARSSS